MANNAAKGYVALRNFDLNGDPKIAGSIITDISAAEAEPYLAVGVIVDAPADPVEEAPAAAEAPAAPLVDHSSYE